MMGVTEKQHVPDWFKRIKKESALRVATPACFESLGIIVLMQKQIIMSFSESFCSTNIEMITYLLAHGSLCLRMTHLGEAPAGRRSFWLGDQKQIFSCLADYSVNIDMAKGKGNWAATTKL